MAMIELTRRDIPGNGGSVALNVSMPDDGHYQVVLTLPDGDTRTLDSTTRSQAVEDYYHPFVYASVPDVFKPELVSVE